MMIALWIALFLSLGAGQSDIRPAYEREGDRVEQQFRAYRDRLEQFYLALCNIVEQKAPELRPELQGAVPPPASVYGYQFLPTITDNPARSETPVSLFSYSWPITKGYVDGETIKLAMSEAELRDFAASAGAAMQKKMIATLVREYRELLVNQRTVDQYIEYNRFWQRSIAMDRPRFDRLTLLYELMKSGERTTAEAIREALGKPDVPSFVRVTHNSASKTTVEIPVYTDIEDRNFLAMAKTAVEETWRASEPGMDYSVHVDFRFRTASQLYSGVSIPANGDHINLTAHAARFPDDGAILTTGAESTHSILGRYIALGPGDLSVRTLAHEFGHLLGFRDGYIRGYRDLGDEGFEIMELTTTFDDIMSAPREGHVQAAHFKMIMEVLNGKSGR